MKITIALSFCLACLGCANSASLGVVDGGEVEKNSIPYQAHLYLESDFLYGWNCTGVLISENYVLTTSKCMWSGVTRVNVTLGANNVREAESTQQFFVDTKLSWKIYNVGFVYATMENNIALVKLPQPAILNEYVQVAKLPTSDTIEVGQSGTISGWGVNGNAQETVLQKASATIVDNSVCASEYTTTYIGDKVLCVQGDDNASACNGDGGAPLVIDGVVVGVYSGGPIYVVDYDIKDCSNKPNIFTKVASFLDWIIGHSDV